MSGPVTLLPQPVRLAYTVPAGRALSRFLRGMERGVILGQRCPACGKVYVPPRGACPACGVATVEEVEVRDAGTVTTFAVVHIPFPGQAPEIRLPYVCAHVLLDGADVPVLHLVAEVPADEVRMGLRVRAVWAPPEERRPSFESIRWFRPSGGPDAERP